MKFRGFAKFVLALISIPAALVLFTAANVTGVGALLCPWCFGFERLEPGVFVEARASEAYRQEIRAWIHDSKEKIGLFFGSQISDPAIFACVTGYCYSRVERRGGQTLGISFLDWVIVLSPQINSGVAITHELAHAEVHNRLGPKMFAVPAWFDEGLAVNVSDDPRYLAPIETNDRCLMELTGPLPATDFGWVRATQMTNRPYGEAACIVSRWLAAKDGRNAVLKLIAEINAGSAFEKAYR